MVLFSGKAYGRADFYSTEATDGFDLCLKLFPSCPREDIPKRFRMWVEIPDATTAATNETFWADVCLKSNNSNIYEAAVEEALKISDTVNVIIRGADAHSPNSSPEVATGTEPKTPAKFLPPSPRDLETTQSSLTVSTTGISPVSSKTISASSNTFEISGALNTVEPFTMVDITEASGENSQLNLIPLFFAKVQRRRVVRNHSVILVDLEGLESFVESQISMGKSPLNLCLNDVPCRGGKSKNFSLTSDVWMGSILPRSRYFRAVFSSAGCAEACRTEQLKELKTQAPCLFYHLLFWIDDMVDFEEAQWRLDARFEATDISKVMSPYYFTEPEARYLGNFFVEGSANTLKQTLDNLAASQDELCTSSDLVPLLERTFKIEKKREVDYEEKRAAWMEEALVVSKMPRGHDVL